MPSCDSAESKCFGHIFLLGGLGIIGFFVGLKDLKESPRWLVAQGRVDEAEQVIEELTKVKVDLSEAVSKVEPKIKTKEVIVGLFSREYIKRTIVILLFVIFTVPASFVITNWTTTLFSERGLSVEASLTASTLLMFGVPAGCYFSSLIADKGGRKIPMAAMAIAVAVFAQ